MVNLTRTGIAVAALVGLVFAGPSPAGAQGAFPAAPPKPGTPKDFKVPESRRLILDNGLHVTLVQWGTMPMVRASLRIRSGNAFEKANEIWLADLTGDLMREGTATRNSTQISQEAARMGGELTVNVGPDVTGITSEVLSEFGPQIIELIADVAAHPAFPASELARLKGNLLRNLAVALSQPQQLALQKFRQVLYKDHPYGRIFSTEDMVKGFTLAQVLDFYRANYGAGRAHLFVVGRFDEAAVEAAVKKAFAGWTRGSAPAVEPPKPSSTRTIHIIDRPGAVQSTIVVGVPTINPADDDFIPLSVMDALLGGAFASRITRNIREDKGYTYSPYSELSSRYRDTYWAEYADVTTNVTGASLQEIFAEIDRLQSTPPSQDEVTGIQNFVAGTYVLQNSSRAGIASQLAYMDLHGLAPEYASTFVKRVYAVTPQQVTELARRYIDDDRATIVIVGDRKVIEKQVGQFGKIAETAQPETPRAPHP